MLWKNFRGRPYQNRRIRWELHRYLQYHPTCPPMNFSPILISVEGSLQACVKGVKAMSPLANLPRASVTIVKLRLHRVPQEKEKEKKEEREKINDRETPSSCFGRRRRRRRPYATAFSLFHPRAEKRPHNRGMRKQNQYTAPPPSDGNVRANHPWMPSLDVVRLSFPSLLDGRTHASRKVGSTDTYLSHVFLADDTIHSRDNRGFQAGQLIELNRAECKHVSKNIWNF